MSLVEQELPTLPQHLSSPLGFSGARVTRSLVLYVCFVDRCLSFCAFSFGHCVVSSSSIYGFWLLLWYFQTLLIMIYLQIHGQHWSATHYWTTCIWFQKLQISYISYFLKWRRSNWRDGVVAQISENKMLK